MGSTTCHETLKIIVEVIQSIPTLSSVVYHITLLMDNPRTSALEVGEAISRDQALTAKVLKLVNSAYYGFPRKVNTVSQAVAILGYNQIKNLVLTASVFDIVSNADSSQSFFDKIKFWEHSLGCATAAKIISQEIGLKKTEENFVAGLLHDLGKIIIYHFLEGESAEVLRIAGEQDLLLIEAEQEILGINHTYAGKLLANKWNLPRDITAAISFHHNPLIAKDYFLLCSIIHLGDILCRCLNIGSGGDNKVPLLNEKSWDALNLSWDNIGHIFSRIEKEMEKAQVFLGLLEA
jgi:HD-like signal output (HDOD) protein